MLVKRIIAILFYFIYLLWSIKALPIRWHLSTDPKKVREQLMGTYRATALLEKVSRKILRSTYLALCLITNKN